MGTSRSTATGPHGDWARGDGDRMATGPHGNGTARRRGAGDGARAMFALALGVRCPAFDRWGEFW